MMMMMTATVVTGFLMLKFERNMALLPRDDARRLIVGFDLRDLPVLERRVRVAKNAVTFDEPADHGELAGTLVALAEREFDLVHLAVFHAPGEHVVAFVHDRRGRHGHRHARARLDPAL